MRPNECASDADCRANGSYANKFCSLATVPRRCLDAPACTGDAECGTLGLVCDRTAGSESAGRCVNGAPCPNGTECQNAQLCERGACVGKSCLNTPNFCPAGQSCDQTTGLCVPDQQSGCSKDEDCAPGLYCHTPVATCLPGCRTSADCANGLCDAAHQCQTASGGLCGTCVADSDCPVGTTCYESPLTKTKTCRESCNVISSQLCTMGSRAQCIFFVCSCGI